MSSYAERQVQKKKKNLRLNFISSVGFQASKIFEDLLQNNFWNHFQEKIVWFGNSLPHDLENQQSWEIGLDGFWGNRIQRCKNVSADKFFVCFWATIIEWRIALKYCVLFFLIFYLEEFQPMKY